MVAAAIPEGSKVMLPEDLGEMLIDHKENSTPRAGKITWRDKNGNEAIVGGNVRIHVIALPHELEEE